MRSYANVFRRMAYVSRTMNAIIIGGCIVILALSALVATFCAGVARGIAIATTAEDAIEVMRREIRKQNLANIRETYYK